LRWRLRRHDRLVLRCGAALQPVLSGNGYGGTTQRVEQYSDRILDQIMHVRFDANTNGILWDFEPVQREIELRIGETTQISYKATNRGSRAVTGKATFNVTPELAAAISTRWSVSALPTRR
jgi:cytochrome c oxidase assembly protein Cox11